MAKVTRTVTYQETVAIKAFLGYLQKNYSKLINPNDVFLISAIASWERQESGGLSRVIGNNPFNIRKSPLQSGSRLSRNGNGHFAIFSSMAKGFEAAAYLLIHGGGAKDAYGYRTALNALKHGGNQAAVDFLAALAMSSWDAAHYGASSWLAAYKPETNNLLYVYLSFGGVQLSDPNPHPKPKPKTMPPLLPRDFNYNVVVRNYLDPYAAGDLYSKRHRRGSVVVEKSSKR
jgi:hypothetical protein